MYVMVGEFVTESNANVPKKCNLKDYDLAFDKECIQKMRVEDVFMRNGINIIPSINTAHKANCQLYPIPKTTVYAKNALSPIPGASAIG